MKSILLGLTLSLTLTLSTSPVMAGGIVDDNRPSVQIQCLENQMTIRQNGTHLTVRLDPSHPMVAQLADSGFLVRGYAHDAGFLTKDLIVNSKDLLLSETDPTSVRTLRTEGVAIVSNHYDYSISRYEAMPNGQKVRGIVSMTQRGSSAASLAFQKIAEPLHRCLKTEKQDFGGIIVDACVETEIAVPGYVIEELRTDVSFANCKVVK